MTAHHATPAHHTPSAHHATPAHHTPSAHHATPAHHAAYLAASTWRHTKPKKPYLARPDAIRLISGIIIAAVAGWFVADGNEDAFVLVNVGSFFGALISVLGGHHSKLVGTAAGVVMIDAGVVVGILLIDHPVLATVIMTLGIFAAGLARSVSVGAFMRLLFAAMAVAAVSELSGMATTPQGPWLGFAAFLLGQLIVTIITCLRRPGPLFGAQRNAVARLYEQLARLAEGAPADYVPARMGAQRALGAVSTIEFLHARWVRRLVELADDVAAEVSAGGRPGDQPALEWIGAVLRGEGTGQPPEGTDRSGGVEHAVRVTEERDSTPRRIGLLAAITPSDMAGYFAREVRDPRGSVFRFAARLALTGLVCEVVGRFLIQNLGNGLPLHGFWTVLAGCLMVMPDYHDTEGKVIARTGGSIIGAFLGTALALIPFLHTGLPFAVMATLFVLGYLAVRSMSQAVLMVEVVAWLGFILGGGPAAFTRALDTAVGAVIATVVFFLIPTWNVDRLRPLFHDWCSYAAAAVSMLSAERSPDGDRAAGDQANGDGTTSSTRGPAERVALTHMYRAQRRFEAAAAAVPREPRREETPWPVERLPQITAAMDRAALAILHVRRADDVAASPSRPGPASASIDYAEWFETLSLAGEESGSAGGEPSDAGEPDAGKSVGRRAHTEPRHAASSPLYEALSHLEALTRPGA